MKLINMLKNLWSACALVVLLSVALPNALWAQGGGETTVEFFSDNATMEDDPKQGVYNISIYSPDGQWKVQLNYHANSMFGTFTNADFRLDGDGKNYNYARNPANDMQFYSFVDMSVSVTDESTLYRVKANCLASNKTRFIIEATIDAPQPTSTISDDLGYARVVENSFFGTYNIKAENERYLLEYGVVSEDLIGTFYRADILQPNLKDKTTGKTIKLSSAYAVHTQVGNRKNFQIELLSTDLVLYRLTMYNEPIEIEVKAEKNIDIYSGVVLQDLTEMYGCYQFGGQNSEYAVAIAVTPEVFESGRTEWSQEDIFLPYTNLLKIADETFVEIFSVQATLTRTEESATLSAEVLSMEGVLYHINMYMGKSNVAPSYKETVNIDFGHVAMLDYTQEIGKMGVGALVTDKYQMRFYLYTGTLKGEYTNEDFDLEMCDVMVVDEERETFVFHDAQYVTAKVEEVGGVKHLTVDMIGVDEVLYHATMHLDPLKCLAEEVDVPIGLEDDVFMVAVQASAPGYAEYILQFQNMDNVYDDDYNMIGDGYNLSFHFAHEGEACVTGEYGYSAETLAEDEPHMFYENGCEVRVGPVAGTLTIVPLEKVSVPMDDVTVETYAYGIRAKFLGQNNVIYNAEGWNCLLCIGLDGEFVNMDESDYMDIQEVLAEQGYKVRKVLKDGKIIIEKMGKEYDLMGR